MEQDRGQRLRRPVHEAAQLRHAASLRDRRLLRGRVRLLPHQRPKAQEGEGHQGIDFF